MLDDVDKDALATKRFSGLSIQSLSAKVLDLVQESVEKAALKTRQSTRQSKKIPQDEKSGVEVDFDLGDSDDIFKDEDDG